MPPLTVTVSWGFTSHSAQNRSRRRRFFHPISWSGTEETEPNATKANIHQEHEDAITPNIHKQLKPCLVAFYYYYYYTISGLETMQPYSTVSGVHTRGFYAAGTLLAIKQRLNCRISLTSCGRSHPRDAGRISEWTWGSEPTRRIRLNLTQVSGQLLPFLMLQMRILVPVDLKYA